MVRSAMMAILILAGLFLAGCMDGAKEKYDEVSQSDEARVAKKAWGAINLAANITNPLYYAKKGASLGAEKFKESRSSDDDE